MKQPSIILGQDKLLAYPNQPQSAEKLRLEAESCSKAIMILQIIIRAFPTNRRNDKYYWMIGELCDKRAYLQIELEYMKEREVAA